MTTRRGTTMSASSIVSEMWWRDVSSHYVSLTRQGFQPRNNRWGIRKVLVLNFARILMPLGAVSWILCLSTETQAKQVFFLIPSAPGLPSMILGDGLAPCTRKIGARRSTLQLLNSLLCFGSCSRLKLWKYLRFCVHLISYQVALLCFVVDTHVAVWSPRYFVSPQIHRIVLV